jgi:hypothetical protein
MPQNTWPEMHCRRPIVSYAAAAFAGGFLVACSPASTAHLDAFRSGAATTRAQPALRRGMNFGDAMDAPNEGEWGVAL